MRILATFLILLLAVGCERSSRGASPDSANAGGPAPSPAAPQAGSARAASSSGAAGIELWLSRAPGEEGALPRLRADIPGAKIDSAFLENDDDPEATEVPQFHLGAMLDEPGEYEVAVTGPGSYELSYTATLRTGDGVQRLTGQQRIGRGETHRYRLGFDPIDTARCTLSRN